MTEHYLSLCISDQSKHLDFSVIYLQLLCSDKMATHARLQASLATLFNNSQHFLERITAETPYQIGKPQNHNNSVTRLQNFTKQIYFTGSVCKLVLQSLALHGLLVVPVTTIPIAVQMFHVYPHTKREKCISIQWCCLN